MVHLTVVTRKQWDDCRLLFSLIRNRRIGFFEFVIDINDIFLEISGKIFKECSKNTKESSDKLEIVFVIKELDFYNTIYFVCIMELFHFTK